MEILNFELGTENLELINIFPVPQFPLLSSDYQLFMLEEIECRNLAYF